MSKFHNDNSSCGEGGREGLQLQVNRGVYHLWSTTHFLLLCLKQGCRHLSVCWCGFMWRKIQATRNLIRVFVMMWNCKKVKQKEEYSGSYTQCNLVFTTCGDANTNTPMSSSDPSRAEWSFIKKEGKKRAECSTFYSILSVEGKLLNDWL